MEAGGYRRAESAGQDRDPQPAGTDSRIARNMGGHEYIAPLTRLRTGRGDEVCRQRVPSGLSRSPRPCETSELVDGADRAGRGRLLARGAGVLRIRAPLGF